MKAALQFDFSVDKENKTINVVRAFDADLNLVWDAWTKPELLDQWWGPKPYWVETKIMDFREGGLWLYSMNGPDNSRNWSRSDFQKIETQNSFSAQDAFCDESGNPITEMASMLWTNNFKDAEGETVVTMELCFDKLEDLEKIIEMGFKQGFTMCLDQLDELLGKSSGSRN